MTYEQYLNETRKIRVAVLYFAGLESLGYENSNKLEKWIKKELIMAVRVMFADPRQKNKQTLIHVVSYGGVKGIGHVYNVINQFKINQPEIGKMFKTVALGSEYRLSNLENKGEIAVVDYIVHTPDYKKTGHSFVTNKLLQAALPEGNEEELHASSDLLCRAATVFSWGFFAGGGKTVSKQLNQLKKLQSISTNDAPVRASIVYAKGGLEPNRANLMARMQKENKEILMRDFASIEEFLEGSGLIKLTHRVEQDKKLNDSYKSLQSIKRGDNLAGIFLREERSALINRFVRQKESIAVTQKAAPQKTVPQKKKNKYTITKLFSFFQISKRINRNGVNNGVNNIFHITDIPNSREVSIDFNGINRLDMLSTIISR